MRWVLIAFTVLLTNVAEAERPIEIEQLKLKHAHWVMFGDKSQRRVALKVIVQERDRRMVAPLVYALRFSGGNVRPEIVHTLEKITRKRYGDDWFRWMEWVQDHSEAGTIVGFDVYLSRVLKALDPDFSEFIYPGVTHSIPLHEVVWGGVAAKDGIPPLDHPDMIKAKDANYLGANELVFGIAINGDVRAYPYRFMDWHEMLNDTIGGEPVSLAYCTLCGSGILYATGGRDKTNDTRKFGSSGLLYRSNKLMFDYETMTLWNQFTGRPVIGRLATQDIALPVLPLVTTSWGEWQNLHPDTKVMSPQTGFDRDYQPGKPYGKYFSSPALMFPSPDDERSLAQKAIVFGLRVAGYGKAWPLQRFRRQAVINDQIGTLQVVLVGSAENREVRAYRRAQYEFATDVEFGIEELSSSDGSEWLMTEDALVSPAGERLTRLPGHLGYWFAWNNYFGADTLAE